MKGNMQVEHSDVETRAASNTVIPAREQIETFATSALLDEVYTTPKPGLVDLHDNGAHTDMDIHTFEESTRVIVPYLADMYCIGISWKEKLPQLFARVRETGKEAECAMFSATGGVNTHKGAIFTLGCIISCTGYVLAHDKMSHRASGEQHRKAHLDDNSAAFDIVTRILDCVRGMTFSVLEADFAAMKMREPRTHGEQLFAQYGERGVRAQAQQGFPIIKNTAFPLLVRCQQNGIKENVRNVMTLLHIMAELRDTNVISRTSCDDLHWLQQQALRIVSGKSTFTRDDIYYVQVLNEQCIVKNISPGGAADILAASLFLLRLCNEMRKEFMTLVQSEC